MLMQRKSLAYIHVFYSFISFAPFPFYMQAHQRQHFGFHTEILSSDARTAFLRKYLSLLWTTVPCWARLPTSLPRLASRKRDVEVLTRWALRAVLSMWLDLSEEDVFCLHLSV